MDGFATPFVTAGEPPVADPLELSRCFRGSWRSRQSWRRTSSILHQRQAASTARQSLDARCAYLAGWRFARITFGKVSIAPTPAATERLASRAVSFALGLSIMTRTMTSSTT